MLTLPSASLDSLPEQLTKLPPESRRELIELLGEAEKRRKQRAIDRYKPYDKQAEFHRLGATNRERLLLGGNQTGKTIAGGAETAYHLTGEYPSWWDGWRCTGPVSGWVGGVTGESTRDNPQRILIGSPQRREEWGTGLIPGRSIINTTPARGIADALDSVVVRHKSGGESVLLFKSYEKGREKWQGDTLDWMWLDEEPPPDIYTEALTRTNARQGRVILTCTPLLGMSDVMLMFLEDEKR